MLIHVISIFSGMGGGGGLTEVSGLIATIGVFISFLVFHLLSVLCGLYMF